MSRTHLTFPCVGDTLAGTLDQREATTGLLIVSGGNEIRSGTFAGQAGLAARVAAAGYPVFRFDRRGVGDSEGRNRGFRESSADIRAAIAAFRKACPHITRIIAFGNCDAASALVLMAGEDCDGLVLSNPWTFDENGQQDAPGAVRARYAAKLRNPGEIGRLLRGKVNFSALFRGLLTAMRPRSAPTTLARAMQQGLDDLGKPCTILIAANDRTGLAFLETCNPAKLDIRKCEGASHAYVEPHARDWLDREILEALRG